MKPCITWGTRARIVLLSVLLPIGLSACRDAGTEFPVAGLPTPIANGESPLQTMCRIQRAFRALPFPLRESVVYIPAQTIRRFGAAPYERRGFAIIKLREEAIAFIRKYSRIELVASLTPLFVDPQVGGDAAVLLAGLPVGPEETHSALTGNFANQVMDSGYQSANSPGTWFENVDQKFRLSGSLYGTVNKTSNILKRNVPEYSGSLEEALSNFVSAYGQAPYNPLTQSLQAYLPTTGDPALAWAQENPAPPLSDKAMALIEAHKSDFAAIAIMPLLGDTGSSLNSTETYMMWLLGLEEEFWPAFINTRTGNPLMRTMREEFRHRYVHRLSRICDDSH